MRGRLCHAPVSPTLWLPQKVLLPGVCARCSPHCFPESTELSRTLPRLPFLQPNSYKRPSLYALPSSRERCPDAHRRRRVSSSPQTLLCRDCSQSLGSLSDPVILDGQVEASERGLWRGQRLSCPSPAALGIHHDSLRARQLGLSTL